MRNFESLSLLLETCRTRGDSVRGKVLGVPSQGRMWACRVNDSNAVRGARAAELLCWLRQSCSTKHRVSFLTPTNSILTLLPTTHNHILVKHRNHG